MFFAVILGINSDKFHYNSVSSKGTVIFCGISWPYYKYPRILVYFSLKKYPNFQNSTVDMEFSFMGYF